MTDTHTSNSPADIDHVEAQGSRRSPRFWWMLIVSLVLVIVAMLAIFMGVSA